MAQNLGVVLFSEAQVGRLVEPIGYGLSDGWIIQTDNRVVRCDVCRTKLKANNLGHIVKGSIKLLCDDPACVLEHLSTKFEF